MELVFFLVSSIIGGLLIENYSITSQYISETYAIDTEYGLVLRNFGYIHSGIVLSIFAFSGYKKFPKATLTKIGFYGLGKLLMIDFLQRIENSKFERVILDANPNAEKFYSKLGFRVIGKIKSSVKNRFLPIMELKI